MTDYTWPSVYFAYLFFAICFFMAVFFFIRSWKDGYWSKQGEEVKYQIFDDAVRGDDLSRGTARFQERHDVSR